MRILVVEDELKVAHALKEGLEGERYDVALASTGEEAFFQVNSVLNGTGLPDGVAQYWFNGTLVIDRHDVLFRTGARPNINFRQFIIAPYIGDGSPVNQTMWIDNLVVATGRP